jgi:hypothetical protein
MRCRSGARQRALHLFETFKAHASVIPLAGLCLAGERRIGDPFPVQSFSFFAHHFVRARRGSSPNQYPLRAQGIRDDD